MSVGCIVEKVFAVASPPVGWANPNIPSGRAHQVIGSPGLLVIGSHSERPGEADIPALMFGMPVR